MKKLLLALLLVPALLSAQDFRHRYFHYDQIYTDPDNNFNISASTIDTADNKELQLCGGGATGPATCSNTRGAYVEIRGNEWGGASGDIQYIAGNTGTGKHTFYTGSGSLRLTIPYLADVDDVDLVFGSVTTTAPIFTIRGQTADGDDDGTLHMCPGGLCANSTRGGGFSAYGNEYASAPGDAVVRSGNVAGASVDIALGAGQTWYFLNSATATVYDLAYGPAGTADMVVTLRSAQADGSDTAKLQLTAGGSSTLSGARGAYIQLEGADVGGTANFGGDINIVGGVGASATAGQYPVITIRNDSADGSDWGHISIAAGGAVGNSSRGAYIELDGNEDTVGGQGSATLSTGDKAGAVLAITSENNTGEIRFNTGVAAAAAIRWKIPGQTTATTTDLVFGRSTIASSVASIRGERADGSDDGILQITAGGSSTLSGARGAYLQLEGQDVGGVDLGGDINLIAGAGKSGGGDGPVITIRPDTADEQDRGVTCIGAGGLCANQNRGAYINLAGNEYSGSGVAQLYAGNGTGIISVAQNTGGLNLAMAAGGKIWHSGGGLSSSSNWKNIACEEITVPVGSGLDPVVVSGTNLCASGTLLGLGARVTQAPGGGATTFDVGCTGSGNLDQFCDGLSTALATACAYPTNGDGTNTLWVQKTATTMTITTDADVSISDMKIRVCPYYFDSTAPTS